MRKALRAPTSTSILLLAVAVSGCGYRPARYADRPPVEQVFDQAPIPIPRRTRHIEAVHLSEIYLRRPIVDALDAERFPYARDVNALDQVPRSSWWAPVALDPGAFERDWATDGPPRGKLVSHGQGRPRLVTDARGRSYTLVWDPQGAPGTTTAAAIIAGRVFRALGYRTPGVWLGSARSLGIAARSPSDRVAVVRWPVGVDLGPTDMTRSREDDPNDRVSHRDRRTLRVLGIFAEWLDLRELGPGRLVDVYLGLPRRGHVQHWVVGLEDALGASAFGDRAGATSAAAGTIRGEPLANLLTFGLARPALHPSATATSLGGFTAELRPKWKLADPWEPTDRVLPPDGYWAAKRMLAIPLALLRSAIDAAQLEDPALARDLLEALEARRRALAARWFAKVTPCEVESFDGSRLVLRDLAVVERFESERSSDYVVRLLDDQGRETARPRATAGEPGKLAIRLPAGAPEHPYRVLQIRALRSGAPAPRALELHLVPDGPRHRILGVRH